MFTGLLPDGSPQKIESTGTEKVNLRISTCSTDSSTKVRKDLKNIK